MERNIHLEIQYKESELSRLPDAWLVYKTINGKKQPYLQWHEDGRTKSRYVKMDEREQVLRDMERRKVVKADYERLCAWRDHLQEAWKAYPEIGPQSCLTYRMNIGYDSLAQVREAKLFYVDKTLFLREWWNRGNKVDLILRPRRFGKTLNLDTVDCFFSAQHGKHPEYFRDLKIWREAGWPEMQGTWPVIRFTFAAVKSKEFPGQIAHIRGELWSLYLQHLFLKDGDRLPEEKKQLYENTLAGIINSDVKVMEQSLRILSELLYDYYQKRVIILLDEYDTPLTEAEHGRNYRETVEFLREIFNCSLKTNPWLHKALLTGITRVSKESLFSDMNNLQVSSVTDNRYTEFFGFTEEEVWASMDSQGLTDKASVKAWYDGFRIGERKDMYNPWSIVNYLDSGTLNTYWVNTASDTVIGRLIRQSDTVLMNRMQQLLQGDTIEVKVQEHVIFPELMRADEVEEEAVWGLLLAAGYLTVESINAMSGKYSLRLPNFEVRIMFDRMFRHWFSSRSEADYEDFLTAMLTGDVETMQECLTDITWGTFSIFDVGGMHSSKRAEVFYHGFFLGLISSLRKYYRITSNRESGRGRYDCMLEPRKAGEETADSIDWQKMPAGERNAVILEFKVRKESDVSLRSAAEDGLRQIEEKEYRQELWNHGIPDERILVYGIAFEGKEVMVVKGTNVSDREANV